MGYTSPEVKNRYNNKVYGNIHIQLPKDLVAKFKGRCKRLDVSQASVLKAAIEEFLEETALTKEDPHEDN